ncbi:MAG: hypothetical protein U9N49_01035 [Campylobacterota bacterium]|nr:hypothetical protein [Campylobacterota bacterium]
MAMDFSGDLNPKMAMALFGGATVAGFLINRSLKLIIGALISISVAVVLFVIVSQNPYIHLDQEVTDHIMNKFYYSWIDKPKGWWDVIIHARLADFRVNYLYKPLIALAGFGFGFVLLAKYFGDPKPPKEAPKK